MTGDTDQQQPFGARRCSERFGRLANELCDIDRFAVRQKRLLSRTFMPLHIPNGFRTATDPATAAAHREADCRRIVLLTSQKATIPG